LDLAEEINTLVVSKQPKITAREQYVACVLCALGLAFTNNRTLESIQADIRGIYKQMVRTEKDEKRLKSKLKSVPKEPT